MLAADVVGDGIREFTNNADGPVFLERELVGLGVDGYRQTGVGAGERFGRDVDGTRLAAGTVAGEGSIGGGGGTRAEDLAEVGQFAEVNGGGYLQEIEGGGV